MWEALYFDLGSPKIHLSGDENVIANPPDDTVSRLRFNLNPQNGQQFICSGSWAMMFEFDKLPHNNNLQVGLGPNYTST